MNEQKKDRYLLICEDIIVTLSIIVFLLVTYLISFIDTSDLVKGIIMVSAFLILFALIIFAVKLEQITGYYECKKCGHRYVPTFKSVLFASHFGRTRHLRCPACNKKSWSRKVLEK